MILGRVNIICTPPRTDEVELFFWPEPFVQYLYSTEPARYLPYPGIRCFANLVPLCMEEGTLFEQDKLYSLGITLHLAKNQQPTTTT